MSIGLSSIRGAKNHFKLVFVTCYDYQTALWLNETKIDGILVGDSLAELVYGFSDTTSMTMEIMLRHTEAVKRGLKKIHLVADMPVNSYSTPEMALKNAKRFMEIGADSVKMENPGSVVLTTVLEEGIPVLGHVGLTPQTNQNYKRQGTDVDSAEKIYEDALRLDRLGCYALVLEAIPDHLASRITSGVKAVTLGIASGKDCDGQIRVYMDVVGLTKREKKFVHAEASLGLDLVQAVDSFVDTVR